MLEHNHELGTDNKTADQQDIFRISSDLGLGELNIVTSYRLCKKIEGKTRPLKVVLDSKAQRKFILENAKYIATKARAKFKRVIITKELTEEQRKERRERAKHRRNERNGQRQQRGTEIDTSEDEAAQQRGTGDAATMLVDEEEPSPIHVASRTALSHLAADSSYMNDTECLQRDNSNRRRYNNTCRWFRYTRGRLRWPPPAPPNTS